MRGAAIDELGLFPRSEAGYFGDVDAVDADIVQFPIAIGRKLLHYGPVNAPDAQEAGQREHLHGRVSVLVDRPPDFGLDRSNPIGSPFPLDADEVECCDAKVNGAMQTLM